MTWRKIKRDSDGSIKQHIADTMYALLPIVVRGAEKSVLFIDKDNWVYAKGNIDRHPRYTHYLPVPELKEE